MDSECARPFESDVPLPRGYRLRVIAFMLLSVAAVVLVYVGWDFLAALRRLEAVEQERDEWQRPDGILRAVDLHDGDVVTDLGCGSGYFSLKLSRNVGPRGRVLAVDIRDLPLFVLRVRAWRRGIANISAIKGRRALLGSRLRCLINSHGREKQVLLRPPQCTPGLPHGAAGPAWQSASAAARCHQPCCPQTTSGSHWAAAYVVPGGVSWGAVGDQADPPAGGQGDPPMITHTDPPQGRGS